MVSIALLLSINSTTGLPERSIFMDWIKRRFSGGRDFRSWKEIEGTCRTPYSVFISTMSASTKSSTSALMMDTLSRISSSLVKVLFRLIGPYRNLTVRKQLRCLDRYHIICHSGTVIRKTIRLGCVAALEVLVAELLLLYRQLPFCHEKQSLRAKVGAGILITMDSAPNF